MEVDQDPGVAGAAAEGMHASVGGHAQPEKRPREASPALCLPMLEELAVLMFAVGADKPMAASRALAGASGPTVGLAVLVKQGVVNVWKQRGDAICRSPERPDLKMSQEEAQGWAVAAVVDRELLPDEARPIGKRVDNYFEDNCFERTMVWKSPSWVFRWRMGCWFSVLIICLCHHSISNSWQIHFRHFI